MRLAVTITILMLAIAVVGCGGSERKTAANPTPTTTATIGDALVDAQDIPGCTKSGEGSLYEGAVSRSFECADNLRLTNVVIFHQSVELARKLQDDAWSTRDAVTDHILRGLVARPVDLSSLTVTNVTDRFAKVGAEQESLWCVTFTDIGGTTRVTEFYGAFRYKTAVAAYTANTTMGIPCDSQSTAQLLAHALATRQLERLRKTLG
jgi:hypothetical protein